MLFGKLFLVLGLPWVFESLHHLLHGNHLWKGKRFTPCSSDPVEVFFRITSAFNLLRGVFLFLIFPFKRSVWNKLALRLGADSLVLRRAGGPRGTPAGTGTTVETRMTRDSIEMRNFEGPAEKNEGT